MTLLLTRMASLPKPGKLVMPHMTNSSPIPVKNNGTMSPKPTSPFGSWKDSLDELSKGLQRICNSPVKDGALTPPLARHSPDNVKNGVKLVGSTMQSPNGTVASSFFPTSTGSERPTLVIHDLSDDHLVLRVRHEESTNLLQKQLSLISGYKTTSQENLNSRRPSSKDMAALATKRRRNSVHRFRTTVKLSGCNHNNLFVDFKGDGIYVFKTSTKAEPTLLCTVPVAKSLDLQRLVCTLHGDTLVIMEYPKKVIYIESTNTCFSESYHCPVVAEDALNQTWKLVWHIPEEFEAKHVIVKTIDEKLILLCRHRHTSGSPTSPLVTSALEQLNTDTSTEQPQELLRLKIDLPENVDPKTISAIVSSQRQLIIQGISSWRSRSQTL